MCDLVARSLGIVGMRTIVIIKQITYICGAKISSNIQLCLFSMVIHSYFTVKVYHMAHICL